MIKFESRCIKQNRAGDGIRLILEINKIYSCGYLEILDPGFNIFKIQVQDNITTSLFIDEEEFFQYFDKKGLRKKKLEILNNL